MQRKVIGRIQKLQGAYRNVLVKFSAIEVDLGLVVAAYLEPQAVPLHFTDHVADCVGDTVALFVWTGGGPATSQHAAGPGTTTVTDYTVSGNSTA